MSERIAIYATNQRAGKVVEQIKAIMDKLGPECKIVVVESMRMRDLEILLSEAKEILNKISDNYPICTNVPESTLYELIGKITLMERPVKVVHDER